MIRLTLLLCVGLYLALMVLGEDRGQKRYGLMLADQQPAVTEPVVQAPVETEKVVFIPAQTVMEPTPAPASEPVVTEVAVNTAATPDPLPEPEVDGGKLFTVAAQTANVRQGPGKTFDVMGSLAQGEQVLVVAEENPTEGWSKVRLEGDGIEGYIATRLLTE